MLTKATKTMLQEMDLGAPQVTVNYCADQEENVNILAIIRKQKPVILKKVILAKDQTQVGSRGENIVKVKFILD